MNIFEEIKNRIPLLEVVNKHVQLKYVNNKYLGLCPFHYEKSPSFYVNDVKNLFYCFGCQSGGDLFEFYCKINNCDKKTALKDFCSQLGIELVNNNLDINKISDFFQKNLKTNRKALDFLKLRHINSDSIEYFKLGLLDNFNETINFIQKNNLKLADYGFNEGFLHMLNHRIIFPIFDVNNKIIAFAGRVYEESTQAKYINGYSSKYFNKSKVLYGIYNNQAKIYLVEGYIDVIIMHQFNYKALAGMGTALTEDHLKLAYSYTKNLIIAYDGDSAGQKSMEKIAISSLKLLKNNYTISFVIFPKHHDPASYLIENNQIDLKEYKIHEFFIHLIDFENSTETIKNQVSYYSNLLKQIPDVFIQKEMIKNFFSIYYQKIKNKKVNNQLISVENDYSFLLLCYCLKLYPELMEIIKNNESYFSKNELEVLNEFEIKKLFPQFYEQKITKIAENINQKETAEEKIKNIIFWKKEKINKENDQLCNNFNEETWNKLKNNNDK